MSSGAAVERTFILEDPEGSARALREWGGEDANLIVETVEGKTVLLLDANGTYLNGTTGTNLVVRFGPRGSSHAIRSLTPNETKYVVKIVSGELIVNELPLVAFLSDAYSSESKVVEGVVLRTFPRVFPTTLTSLFVFDVEQITTLTPLSGLNGLVHLELSWCRHLTDLTPMSGLTKLNTLSMKSCDELENIQPLSCLTQLTSLTLFGVERLTDITPLAGLTRLTRLNLSACDYLTDLEPLSLLHQLKELSLYAFDLVSNLEPLSGLTQLTSLDLSYCRRLSDITPLFGMSQLTQLNLTSCTHIRDINPISSLVELSSLDLSFCASLDDFKPLSHLTQLKSLDLSGCGQLKNIDPIATLSRLQSISLRRCEQLADLNSLSNLTQLLELDLSECVQIKDISSISNLIHLTSLSMSDCTQLVDLSPLKGLTQIKCLYLSNCKQLTDLTPLSSVTHLSTLSLSRCGQLTDIYPLSQLKGLSSLDLSYCEKLTDIHPLSGLPQLETLKLNNCRQISVLNPLNTLTHVTHLELGGCTSISDIAPISGMIRLEDLKLSNCESLNDLSPLNSLTQLSSITLNHCNQLSDISPLSRMSSLTRLDLTDCIRLTRVSPLARCPHLSDINLSYSGNVRDLDGLSECPSLNYLKWTEVAAPHSVLASTAFLRRDAEAVESSASDWLSSVPLSKAPDTFGLRLVNAFSLGGSEAWAAAALTNLATALRARARDDDDPRVVSPATWAAWAKAVLGLGDDALRTALHAGLDDLNPARELASVLTPMFTALADLGPANSHPLRSAPEWLVSLARDVLAPLTAKADHARLAAPAAAVFFAGFGLDADVRAWLDHGTHPDAPYWRDRVIHALLTRDAKAGDLSAARRWLGQLVTDDAKDAARATLAEAFASRLPEEAAKELDAIGDDAVRGRIAKKLGKERALLATPAGLYALVLALQDDADALGDTLTALVEAHPGSALVAALAADLAPVTPAPADPLPAVLAHPAWKEEVAGRKWDAFTGALPTASVLLAEAVAARACEAGLLDAEVRGELVEKVAGRADG
jgi:Leucine-rich repeat (LRR) protein